MLPVQWRFLNPHWQLSQLIAKTLISGHPHQQPPGYSPRCRQTLWRKTFLHKLATGVHPNCTSLYICERYLYYTRVDFILDLSENFRQCSVIATKGNEQSLRIPSQMCQTSLFRLSNFIPVDMNDIESDLALVGWTTESLYFSCWKDEPVIHINGEREYCWYCNWKFRSLKFSAPCCRFISLWNFKGVTGVTVVVFRVQLNDIFNYNWDIRPINVKTTKKFSLRP